MNERNRAMTKLLLVFLIWASSYAISRSTVAHMPPFLFALLRYMVAIITLFIIIYPKRHSIRKPAGKVAWPVFILALTGITLYYLFFNASMLYINASTGALIQGFIPVGVVLLATTFLKEPITLRKVAGIMLSVTGVILIGFISKGNEGQAVSNWWGSLLMIASVVCWCVYTVLARKYSGMDPLWLTTAISIVGTLLFIPAVVIELWNKPFPAIGLQEWGAILFMGIFSSAISYLWYNSALKHISASQAGIMLNLDPLMGAAIAVIFLGEPLLPVQIAGAALILAGVWLSSFKHA
jgi:drug/metabolite transporter (DMT)-like permease